MVAVALVRVSTLFCLFFLSLSFWVLSVGAVVKVSSTPCGAFWSSFSSRGLRSTWLQRSRHEPSGSIANWPKPPRETRSVDYLFFTASLHMMSELTQHRARKLYATTKSGITTIVLCATRPLLPQPPSHPSIKESPVTRVRREYGLWPSLPTRAPALRGFHFLSGGVRKPCFCFLPPMVCRDGRSAFGDPSVRLQLGEKRVSLKGNALESSRSSCSSRTNYEVVLEGFHEMAFVLF